MTKLANNNTSERKSEKMTKRAKRKKREWQK